MSVPGAALSIANQFSESDSDHEGMLPISRHISSIYVLVASATIMLERRIAHIAQPNTPQPLGFVKKLLLRIPAMAMSILLLGHFWRLSMMEELPDYSSISFLLFFTLHCFDYIVTGLILTLELGRSELDLNHLHSPGFIEWVGTLYLSTVTLNPSQSPVIGMIIIELHKLLLLDLLDIADCLAPFRLIPTGLLGLVHMVYKIGWSLSKQHRGIPIIFWLSGIPELFLVLFFVIMSAVYVAGYLATGGNMRFRLNQLSEGVTLRDDFKIAIRKFAILISQHRPTHSGFSKELHPIFAPAGIGLPPAALINVHARPTGFRLNLDECENRQRATAWEKTIRALEIHELFATVLNSVYMWRCALMAMFRPMSVFVQDLLRRVLAPSMDRTGLGSAETRSKYKVDLSSEGRISYDDEDGNTFSDLDFELDGTDTSSNWSCELDNENSTETQQNDSVIHPDGDDDDDNDDDDLCKEIFWLAQDMQSSSSDTLGAASNAMTLSPEIHTAVTPTSLISLTQVLQQTLFEVGVMTRSQRRRLNSGPGSTVSTSGGLDQHHTRIWHGATSTKAVPMDDQSSINDSSVRLCVVCQQEPRCIVLRPCGCLCLCDSGCREALALRDYKECPCCRRSVKGYQKIYEP